MSYSMPQQFNGMTELETWKLERAYVKQLLQHSTAAVALQKALDELGTHDAKVMKLKLCITDPDDAEAKAHNDKHNSWTSKE